MPSVCYASDEPYADLALQTVLADGRRGKSAVFCHTPSDQQFHSGTSISEYLGRNKSTWDPLKIHDR